MKKRVISLEAKHKINAKHERGVRVVDLAKEFERSNSTICAIIKQKGTLKTITPAKGVTILSKLQTPLHKEIEKLLLVWVHEKQLAGDTVTKTIICEKEQVIYSDMLK